LEQWLSRLLPCIAPDCEAVAAQRRWSNGFQGYYLALLLTANGMPFVSAERERYALGLA